MTAQANFVCVDGDDELIVIDIKLTERLLADFGFEVRWRVGVRPVINRPVTSLYVQIEAYFETNLTVLVQIVIGDVALKIQQLQHRRFLAVIRRHSIDSDGFFQRFRVVATNHELVRQVVNASCQVPLRHRNNLVTRINGNIEREHPRRVVIKGKPPSPEAHQHDVFYEFRLCREIPRRNRDFQIAIQYIAR